MSLEMRNRNKKKRKEHGEYKVETRLTLFPKRADEHEKQTLLGNSKT